MPEKFRGPRGVQDILPADQPYWRWVRKTAVRVAESYGYGQIETPVFEHAGVFIRPGAEGTDVVDKEVYRFKDRGGDDLVLRPEGTAGVVRAYLEHGMSSLPQPVRLFYIIPNFRYDRPQAGRYRAFYQFGVEAIGEAGPAIDVETIDLLDTYYRTLGLTDAHLQLNSIGDSICRPAYLEKLRGYYADKLDLLCGDCKRRFEINPMRLLDCKNEPCQPFKAGAPKIADNLCDACAEHFATVRRLLDSLGIAYTIEPTLVRGLDYYTRTAYEFQPADETSQSALGGGGRYDRLIEQLGGPPTPGIGFGTGIERIILNLKRAGLTPPEEERPDAYIAIADERAAGYAAGVARTLRGGASPLTIVSGIAGRSLRSQMRHANTIGARYAVVIGARELETRTVTLRDLAGAQEESLAPQDAASRISHSAK